MQNRIRTKALACVPDSEDKAGQTMDFKASENVPGDVLEDAVATGVAASASDEAMSMAKADTGSEALIAAKAGEALAGTFVKSRDPATVELLGGAGFDLLILDAEHAPMGRADLGLLLMATRAAGVAALNS